MKYINNKHAMAAASSLEVLGALWPLTSGFLLLAQPVLLGAASTFPNLVFSFILQTITLADTIAHANTTNTITQLTPKHN